MLKTTKNTTNFLYIAKKIPFASALIPSICEGRLGEHDLLKVVEQAEANQDSSAPGGNIVNELSKQQVLVHYLKVTL